MLQTNKSENQFKAQPIMSPDDLVFTDFDSLAYKDTIEKNPMINKRNLLNDNGRAPAAAVVDPLEGNNNDMIENLKKFDEFNDIDPAAATLAENKPNIKRIQSPEEFNEVLRGNKSDQIVVVEIPQSVLMKNAPTDGQLPKSKEGRIAIYGDSNCLDSTHLDKPCFWLLDALLEYTMTAHVPGLLNDLNRSGKTTFADTVTLPSRLPNNNLHQYSKVLDNQNANRKRDIPQCPQLVWETPIYLNVTAGGGGGADMHANQYRSSAEELADGGAVNLRRKLERQKGEVRRDFS